MSSATPTPSPRPTWFEGAGSTPRRPATRAAHTRVSSYSTQSTFSPRPPRDSPRYNSSGEYATVDVSYNNSSSRRPSVSFQRPSKHNRRSSFTHVRSSTPYGESDEDEIIETLGCTYVLPAQTWHKGRLYTHPPVDKYAFRNTNRGPLPQDVAYYESQGRDSAYESPRQPSSRPPTSLSHSRRASTAVPQRPSTVRPTAASTTRPPVVKAPVIPKATEEDAARHKIPPGYSLKNWDPREPPILLLGSVFDANSLGKWIYDWTVYSVGSREPLAEMAGELWLLLLELSEKMDRGERIVGKIRSKEKKATVEDFLDGGERIMHKFRTLLKYCESPMLKASTKKKSSLGKGSGVEFVDTLFGRDRELLKTEKWMAQVRTWSLRFDANCTPILANPTL
ncbi:hypothetical protein N3K66_004753 [Trichothecium roseum]|uniref:Uncharacterized protein n=1 Tax=Trichothecium roseum TaxID=47278 RepID=A0ACC0V2W4_9HYPO|nr:hypothetical protein N3K66_004753 [Trichothecium roseum]